MIRISRLWLVLLVVLCLPLSGCIMNSQPGASEKVGTIVRVGKTGVISKTFEAQLLRGGLQDGSGAMGQAFEFTIQDPALVAVAEEAMRRNQEVRVQYDTEFICAATRSDSGCNFARAILPVTHDTTPGHTGTGGSSPTR